MSKTVAVFDQHYSVGCMGNGEGDMSMSYLHLGRSKPIVQPQIVGVNPFGLFCNHGDPIST